MRIAMIGHKRVPGREGGIEVVVEELSTRMAAKGHEVVLYNRHKKGYVSPKVYKEVHIIDVPTIENKNLDAVIYSFFASVKALFGNYNVIHYHAIGPSVFLLIPHLFRKKTVVTVHGLNYKTPKWKGFAARFIMLGEKITARYADEVIVLSQEQRKYFKEKYNRETVYIPNGTVVTEKEPPDIITKKYGLKKNEYLLFVSRVVPGKGLEYLLDAYKNISCEFPLVVAGDTVHAEDFRKMIEEKAASDARVKLIGFVEGKELRELYSNAKLFVFPSEAEGMPMCLLEALSFDCQCLVSDIAENMEVGKEFVATFKSKDKKDLEKKLNECINRKHRCIDSRQYIMNNYSWDNVVVKTLSIYRYKGDEKR